MKKRTSSKAKVNAPRPATPKPPAITSPAGAFTPHLLTMEEAIAMLKTTRPTFYRWVRSGRLRGTKVGRQWRFTIEDIERFLKGQEPQIALTADINPLIGELTTQLKKLDIHTTPKDEQDKMNQTVMLMVRLALAMRATDIHLDPQEKDAFLRFRVDGALHLITRFDLRLLPAVVERWKTMAAMNLQEKSVPQDGRIIATVDNLNTDMRVCCMPTFLGEAVVIRLLYKGGSVALDLDKLPYALHDRQRIDRWLGAGWGVIVISGPTNCGKTTTLYSCLLKVANLHNKIVSIEDPVEYLLPGLTQIQINPKVGLTFERAMRSVLRSDPDVIMLGEIRNLEAIQICFQAALTGHLVLTTMHTNDAAGALCRMTDMGCEPFLVGDATKLIVAQRLVRRLCPDCSVQAAPSADHLAQAEKLAKVGGVDWNTLPRQYRKAVGCAKCGQLGYRGRTLIAETLEVSPAIAAAVRNKAKLSDLRAIAVGEGMTTMAGDGIRRAAEGQVSLAEVLSTVASIDY